MPDSASRRDASPPAASGASGDEREPDDERGAEEQAAQSGGYAPIQRVRSVLLFPRDGAEPREATERAGEWLVAQGLDVAVPSRWLARGGKCPAGCRVMDITREVASLDLAIALGGDGTLLEAAHHVADAGVPVMGINLGHLGFLTAFAADQLMPALRAALEGRLSWEPRLRMRVDVQRKRGTWSQTGSNDVYLKHGEQPRMLSLRTHVGRVHMADYRADGLIVCTPMGSTAYNLAAGGPIVDHGTGTFTITPICPHSLTHRPVVTGAARTIRIEYLGPGDAGPATLSVDGIWGLTLEVGDEVRVSRADRPLKLVPPSASVFDVLTHKLGWSSPRPKGI